MKICDFVIHNKPQFIWDMSSKVKYFTCDFRIHNDILSAYQSS